jgi:hypothetical protein
MSQLEQNKVRQVVLDAINGYHDSVLDLMKAEDGNSVRNEQVVELLQRLEQKVDPRLRANAAVVAT